MSERFTHPFTHSLIQKTFVVLILHQEFLENWDILVHKRDKDTFYMEFTLGGDEKQVQKMKNNSNEWDDYKVYK